MIQRWELINNFTAMLECWRDMSTKLNVSNVKIVLEGGGIDERLEIEQLKTTIFEEPKFEQEDIKSWEERLVYGILEPLWPFSNERPKPKYHIGDEVDDRIENSTIIYWGAHTGMSDNRHKYVNITPELFSDTLNKDFSLMSLSASRSVTKNFYFLDSWNGWKDQAVLEPDNQYGTAFLEALKNSLSHIPTYDNSGSGDQDVEKNTIWEILRHLMGKDYEANRFWRTWHGQRPLMKNIRS